MPQREIQIWAQSSKDLAQTMHLMYTFLFGDSVLLVRKYLEDSFYAFLILKMFSVPEGPFPFCQDL